MSSLKHPAPKTYGRLIMDARNLRPDCRCEKIEKLVFDLAVFDLAGGEDPKSLEKSRKIIEKGRILRAMKKSTKTPLGELRAVLEEKLKLVARIKREAREAQR